VSERPRLRTDLVLVEQTYRGEQSFIVKDPTTRKYFRFRPVEIAVMQVLDGERTVPEAAAALLEQGLKVSAAAVGRFAEKLKAMGLCERTLREKSVLLMERLRAQRRARLRTGPFKGDILRLRWSMGDPDKFMDRTLPYLRFCFTRGFLAASVALFAVYFVILAIKWSDFTGAMADVYLLRASLGDYVVLWAVGTVIVAAHELGHGYTCKYFGGQVHEIGVMMFYFDLAFFCNVNDAWTFPDRNARLWVTAAGSWIQMVIASVAAVVWWLATPDTFISQAALAAFLIGGFFTVLMNLNPLVPLDGYYALCDWLEVSNLRQRSFAHLTWQVKSRWLGLELPEPPADDRERRIFLLYGTMAAAYTGFILLVAALLAYGWVAHALGGIGIALLTVVVWLVTGDVRRSLRRAGGEAWLRVRERWPTPGKAGRVRRWLAAAAALVVLAGLAPWPITVTGPFVVSPTAAAIVAPDSGVVFEVLVREGDRVAPGAPVALVRNLELERAEAAAARAVDSLGARETQARAAGRNGEAAQLIAERTAEATRLAGLAERVRALAIRSPGAAVVVSPRPDTLVGRSVWVGDTLLRLAGAEGLEARLALAGPGASLARPGQRARLIAHADPGRRLDASVTGVAEAASPDGTLESRVLLPAALGLLPGMTGEARVVLRDATVWGALWWAVRSRIRADILL
jgi:hypothetical protein